MICVKCHEEVIGKAVMLQEDALTTQQEEAEGNFEGWKGTPIGPNGMHYMLFHPVHFSQLYEKLFELEKKVSCMLYIGDVGDFIDAVADDDRRR